MGANIEQGFKTRDILSQLGSSLGTKPSHALGDFSTLRNEATDMARRLLAMTRGFANQGELKEVPMPRCTPS